MIFIHVRISFASDGGRSSFRSCACPCGLGSDWQRAWRRCHAGLATKSYFLVVCRNIISTPKYLPPARPQTRDSHTQTSTTYTTRTNAERNTYITHLQVRLRQQLAENHRADQPVNAPAACYVRSDLLRMGHFRCGPHYWRDQVTLTHPLLT